MRDAAELESMLARIALGDRSAFDGLYNATSAKLFGVCLRVLKDRAEAEETLQEVYLRVWDAAVRYRSGEASPISWLVAIARNRSIDRLRARKTRSGREEADGSAADLMADDAPGPEQLAIAAGERNRIVACFEELPPDRSDAVRRAYLDGDSYAELAARYGVPLNTMRTWLRRSLVKLRECLSR